MSGGRGERENREVSPLFLLGPRGDLSGAGAEAIPEEGGSWGKHGFPHGSEPQASDGHDDEVTTIEMRSAGAGSGAIGSLMVRNPRS